MEDDNGMGETQCDLTKPRIAPYKNTWTSPKYGILVQFKARSAERIAILPNNVTCSCSLQHTARRLHWESGMHENEGRALPKDTLNSKIATGCTQIEFAQRSTRSTRPRRKIILGPTQANRRVPGKPGTTPLTTEFRAYLFRHSNSRIKIAKKTRSGSRSKSPRATSTRNPSFRTWARRSRSTNSAKNWRIWSPTWATQRSSSFAKTLPKSNAWQFLLGNRHCLLHLWKIIQKSSQGTKEFDKTNYDVSSIPGYGIKKEKQSRCHTWTVWITTNVLQGSRHVAESSPAQTWRTSIHACAMAQRLRVKKFVVTNRMDRAAKKATWQDCLGGSFIRREENWENSKFDALDSHVKHRRTSATTQSTTRLCSSEKRMQEIARRTPGKDSTRLEDHSSRSTSKTAKRTSVWGNRQTWQSSRSSNRLAVLWRVAGRPVDSVVLVTWAFNSANLT